MPSRARKGAGLTAVGRPAKRKPVAAPNKQRNRKVMLVMQRMSETLARAQAAKAAIAVQADAVKAAVPPVVSLRVRRKWQRTVVVKPALIPVVQNSVLATCDPVLAARLSKVTVEYLVNPGKYDSAFRKYARFCDVRRIQHFPATEQVVCGFVLNSSLTILGRTQGCDRA